MNDEKTMGQVIQIDEARIRDHLGEMVRGTVWRSVTLGRLSIELSSPCSALVTVARTTRIL